MKTPFFVFIFLILHSVSAQNKLHYPLDKIKVTGNFAELRPNHFHAGLDLGTDPVKNLPIYSVDEGYVSRIKVSTYGYGKVIYITHPGGFLSVYAHQHHFADKIEKYIREKQKEKETFELEVFPQKNELPVKWGEIIGYTGNTGASQAPHLHFELRDEKTEVAINPFLHFDFEDAIAPDLKRIYFYETTDMNQPHLICKKDAVTTKNSVSTNNKRIKESKINETILLPECSGFAFTAFDQHVTSGAVNQIYSAEVFIDGQSYYKHVFDSIAFDKSKYINCFTELGGQQSQKIQKCFLSKNEDLSIFKVIKGNGEIYLKDTLVHLVKLVLLDAKFNKSITYFSIKKRKHSELRRSPERKYDCMKEIVLMEKSSKIIFKEKTFFNDVDVFLTSPKKEKYSDVYRVSAPVQGLFLPFTVMIKPFNTRLDTSKLCILEQNASTYCGGQIKDGYVTGTSKKLGNFIVAYDSIAPSVSEIKKSKGNGRLEFSVSDNLSGVGDFKLYINDKWHYCEYENKQAKLFSILTQDLPKGRNKYTLKVWDKRKNLRELKGEFYR